MSVLYNGITITLSELEELRNFMDGDNLEVDETIVVDDIKPCRGRGYRRACLMAEKAKRTPRPLKTRNERKFCVKVLLVQGEFGIGWAGGVRTYTELPETQIRRMVRKGQHSIRDGYYFFYAGPNGAIKEKNKRLHNSQEANAHNAGIQAPNRIRQQEDDRVRRQMARDWSNFEAMKAEEERLAMVAKPLQIDICYAEDANAE